MLITAFAEIENPVAVEALEDQLGRDDNTGWKAAVRTAMQHGGAETRGRLPMGQFCSACLKPINTECFGEPPRSEKLRLM